MECNNPQVPKYLDRNFRKPYKKIWLWYFHKAYRDIPKDGNEIDFPGGRINAISCKWSMLIRKGDLSKVEPYAESYRYAFFKEITSFRLEANMMEENDYKGQHVLTCKIVHTPEACNYSHIEILIKHTIIDFRSGRKKFEQVYSYDDWEKKKPILKKDNKFFKQLRKDFRLKMIATISRLPEHDTLKRDVAAIFHNFNT